jgi:hypothetical protein
MFSNLGNIKINMLRYLIALTSFIIMTLHADAATCPQFKCGGIDQTYKDLNRTCVSQKSDSLYHVEKCTDGFVCRAAAWNDIGQAQNNSTCITESNHTVRANNTVNPGDICFNDTQCFNHDNNVTCSSDKCVTTYTNQSDCPKIGSEIGHEYCPTGHYCKSTKCTPALTKNATCTEDVECKFGLACVATNSPNYDSFTCQAFNSLAINATFNDDKLTFPEDLWLGRNNMCTSNNAIQVDTKGSLYSCRKGDQGTTEKESDLKTAESGTACNYLVYNNTTNPDNATEATDYSICGFNKGTNAYCLKRKGDSWFTEAYSKVSALDLSIYDCHVKSTVSECKDAQDKIDSKTIHNYYKALTETSTTYGYHLYANNDNCVADAITTSYWETESPDMAMHMQILSLAALLMISLMYIF